LKLLKDCLDAGRDKHGCFKEFMDHAKPDVLSVSMNIDLFEIKHVAKIARNPEPVL